MGEVARGAAIFKANCGACHQEKLVGPPMTEMALIYTGNPDGLKSWIKAPGKKRADFPQMPGFPQIPDEGLNEFGQIHFIHPKVIPDMLLALKVIIPTVILILLVIVIILIGVWTLVLMLGKNEDLRRQTILQDTRYLMIKGLY